MMVFLSTVCLPCLLPLEIHRILFWILCSSDSCFKCNRGWSLPPYFICSIFLYCTVFSFTSFFTFFTAFLSALNLTFNFELTVICSVSILYPLYALAFRRGSLLCVDNDVTREICCSSDCWRLGSFMFHFMTNKYMYDYQVMDLACFQQTLPITIHNSHSEASQNTTEQLFCTSRLSIRVTS